MRKLIAFLVVASLAAGCSWERKVKRLSDTEYDHYYALRPFMSDDQRKAYLTTKEEADRNVYLQELGLWDMFYSLSEAERDEILSGEVSIGWTKQKVLMAWGRPYDKRKLAGRPAMRSELYVYRFEKHEDGTIYLWQEGSKTEQKATELFRREVIIDDDRVTELGVKNGW